MKVRDLMSTKVATIHSDTNLAAAGALMWENDCGILPVVDDSEKLIGVITDRDICIALCTRSARSSELTARDIAISRILSCAPDEDVRTALGTMREAKIHRLPVVNNAGTLEGIVSMDDIVACAEKGDGKTEVGYEDVVKALQAIGTHHNQPLVTLAN